ncbi:Glyoxalase [Planctomycetales bacterium 10988]|nr:Glyoxalase [Planctomycetales bacterium 10988]
MSTLPLKRIHHISLQVKDVTITQAFYEDVFGFKSMPRPPFDFPGAWLENYGIHIHLIGGQAPDLSPEEISSRGDHIAFHTEDPDAIEEVLKEHDIPYRINIQSGTKLKQIFFHDPDGHTLEIASYSQVPE